MKKQIVLLLLLFTGVTLSYASGRQNQHLSPDEFKEKQKIFITEKAGLTVEEAEKFFPVYFELQTKKKELNDKAWKLMNGKKDKDMSDAQYDKIMLEIYDARIASDKLDKSYYDKFKKILSPGKIFRVQRAEMRFHREILKGVHRRGAGASSPDKEATAFPGDKSRK